MSMLVVDPAADAERRRGLRSIACSQYLGDPIGRVTTDADRDERAGEVADHVVQKGIGRRTDPDPPAEPLHLELLKVPYG